MRQIEGVGLKVIFITTDGASPNRKFFRMHQNSTDECSRSTCNYKTRNPFAQEERAIFFIADPPHLIKTARNCWSHSAFNGPRLMTVSELYMSIYMKFIHHMCTLIYRETDNSSCGSIYRTCMLSSQAWQYNLKD